MNKIMTNIQLIEYMKELYNEPNYYGSGGPNWSSWVDGGWYVDCTCSIKAILWSGRFIPENRGKPHAGCRYLSNDVPDFTPQKCVEWTNATKGNFAKLVPGEILLMTSQGHAGLYIGNGQVLEVTPAWTGGNPGCQLTQIGKNGERIKNGRQVLSWEYHGKIPVVEYINPEPKPEPTPVDPFPGVSDEELAHRVWQGEFGNGEERKNKLGIRYDAVQNLVNQGIGRDEPDPEPPKEISLGDTVIVNGVGTASSTGEGARTRMFTNQRMKVIMIAGNVNRPNRYALNQYDKGTVNDPSAVTGWFSINDIKK